MRRSVPIGGSDDAWLVLAHSLHRCSLISNHELRPTLAATADAIAINAIAAGVSAQSSLLRSAKALRAMTDPAQLMESGNTAALELFVATQAVAEEQELAGAYGLAFATLNSLLNAFGSHVTARARGNVLAQLGRAVRQLGASDLAQEYYEDAMHLGYEHETLDVVARALLGLGVLGLVRGNYPNAREQFERALVNADCAKDPELIRSAHHGLMNCSISSGDLDSALVHGWNVLRLCIAPDSRAEALMNMAEICRLTGEHDAAIRVYAVAMEWTSHPNVRLHAMSGALQSAVASQRLTTAQRYVAELDALLPTIHDLYARASVGVEIADSLHRLGDVLAASARLEESRSLAARNAFNEVVHRAEQLASAWSVPHATAVTITSEHGRPKRYRSEHFRSVLRSLKGLTAATL
jgi:tetratricopeptide (TPR) repeat protein